MPDTLVRQQCASCAGWEFAVYLDQAGGVRVECAACGLILPEATETEW